jgi:hypothetical protein
MSVTDIERQDKSRQNEERAQNQEFEYKRKINKIVEDRGISREEAELLYLQEVGEFEKASLAYQYRLGHPLLETEREYNDLPTNMRQLHDYCMIDTKSREYSGFEALILSKVVFNRPEETLHHIEYKCMFQFFNRRDLDNKIMML